MFLCGVIAAVPHCDCIVFDDIDALRLSLPLWLAPSRYSQLTLFSKLDNCFPFDILCLGARIL